MKTHLLTNARIVTPHCHFTGTLEIDQGIIAAVHKGKYYRSGLDLKGAWLIPGCIDIHARHLERVLGPADNPVLPLPFGLHSVDAMAACCGVTTVFNALDFTRPSRNMAWGMDLVYQIDVSRDRLLMRHGLHVQVAADTKMEHLPEMPRPGNPFLVVFGEDPLERVSLNQQIERRMEENGASWSEAKEMALAGTRNTKGIDQRRRTFEALSDKCVFGSRDGASVSHIVAARASGAVLAEMPVSLTAARKAKELGMWVCMGAPDIFRVQSVCRDALDEDLVDILCSRDHLPALLGSVVRMMDDGIAPSKAVNMVSLNPARLLQCDRETGSIAPGMKADLVAFHSGRSFASVVSVWVGGIRKLSTAHGA
jgi:alpha-D-ribose 1-methylphosphonate 5-triphosphate diphosphatase